MAGWNVFSFLLSSATLVQGMPRTLVIKGEDTPRDRFSFAEVSFRGVDGNHGCGGTIVAPDMILSAAHCTGGVSEIHIHRHNFEDSRDAYEVRRPTHIENHPLFNITSFSYDFALITLDQPVTHAQPIRLNSNDSLLNPGDSLWVLGFGAIDFSDPLNPIHPDTLQIAQLEYITNSQCAATEVHGEKLYKGEIFPEMMCATSPKSDACSGDSGHCLIKRGTSEGTDLQVGIVSWGRGCALYPGVYSRISRGYDWIRTGICWSSAHPPNYLRCQKHERDPIFLPEISATTFSQSTQIRDEATGESNEGEPNNFFESRLDDETSSLIEVGVEIQLDGRSSDTGWFLTGEDGRKIVDVPGGSYSNGPEKLVSSSISVPIGSKLVFVITDRSGDGIDGWFRVTLRDVHGNTATVKKTTGQFGMVFTQSFIADIQRYKIDSDLLQATNGHVWNREADIASGNNQWNRWTVPSLSILVLQIVVSNR